MHYMPNTGSGEARIAASGKDRSMQSIGRLSSADKTAYISSLTTGTAYTLVDARDSNEYTVVKLADGNVWMIDNLRLGATTLVEDLSTSNTNMSSSVAFSLPSSTNSGDFSVNTPMINTSRANDTTTNYGAGSGKIGVWYNYCAASAGTFCNSSTSSNAAYDICPIGWRLPTGGSNGEFQALYSVYSNNYTIFKVAFSITLSGAYTAYSSYYGRNIIHIGEWGNYWSSSYMDASRMHYLGVSANQFLSNSNPKSEGYMVRCILNV